MRMLITLSIAPGSTAEALLLRLDRQLTNLSDWLREKLHHEFQSDGIHGVSVVSVDVTREDN